LRIREEGFILAEHMETIKKETEYVVKLGQREWNTITLLLGNANDELVIDRAKDNEISKYCINSNLTNLYGFFRGRMRD
jgi:hypothetical protein